MVVMRFDKWGYGNFSGDYWLEDNYIIWDLVDDIFLVYDYFNLYVVVDIVKVGLIGYSEGLIIVFMLVVEDFSIDWLIFFGLFVVFGKEIELV